MPVAAGGPLQGTTQVTRDVPARFLQEDSGTATTTPSLLIGQNESRKSLLIINTGSDILLVGDSRCDIGPRLELPVGGGISYTYVGERWVAAKTTTTTWTYSEESV